MRKNNKKNRKIDVKDYELTNYDFEIYVRNLKKIAPQGHKSVNL
jgi:hypothetical protein